MSAQIFCPDKRQNMYMTDSYSRNSAPPQGTSSYQLRKNLDYLDIESPDPLNYDEYKMKLKLQELERALLNDNDEDGMFGNSQSMEMDGEWSDPVQNGMLHDSPKESSSSDSSLSSISSNKEVSQLSPRTPRRLLFECANAISEGNIEKASTLINELRQLVSIQGDPPQRIAAYMVEVASRTSLVNPSMLNCKPGEALIVNFAFQLHHMPDESVSTVNERDQLLRMAKSLNPKLVTVVEQDVNTNTAPFFPRFTEAYNYYSAVFDSLDATLPRESQDRLNVEKQCLARDIVNIVACEGDERIERYEVAGKWRAKDDDGWLHFMFNHS
ncbi:scarecrow-like protein 1 [Populus alba x Populus x berolinensis]|uniref:Scarecrow-like protein 1 n=1 Tax=Populus alba x Populus x berolinensis TaxID=444605 RepID=A0AAD6RDS3_9ROSI|nr:scarecrow-like protein 1 [Populus alba x Populus x berolinensis]